MAATENGARIQRAVKKTRLRPATIAGTVLALATLAGAGAAVATGGGVAETPNPALFVAEDDDTTIYLLGTIHIVPCQPDTDPPRCESGITPTIREAIAASDEVWLEVAGVLDDANVMAMLGMAMFGDGSRLSDYLPDDEFDLIAEALVEVLGVGVTADAVKAIIDPMLPWLVAILLGTPDEVLSGEWGGGVDFEVEATAGEFGIPVFGFETEGEQLALMGADPLDHQIADLRAQVALLRAGVDLTAVARSAFAELWTIWAAGQLEEFDILTRSEVEVLAEVTDAENAAALGLTEANYVAVMEEIRQLYPADARDEWNVIDERFLADRNINWMEDIEAMLAKPGTFFIAVGAAHIVGEFGLPSLLEGVGATVTRVQ